MTKQENTKLEKCLEQAINQAQTSIWEYEKYEKYKKENNSVEAEIALRKADEYRGYAEGINQVLVELNYKHIRMPELQELVFG